MTGLAKLLIGQVSHFFRSHSFLPSHSFNSSFNAIQPATQVSIRAVQNKSFLTGLFHFSESAAVIGMKISFKHLKVIACFGSCGRTTSLVLLQSLMHV